MTPRRPNKVSRSQRRWTLSELSHKKGQVTQEIYDNMMAAEAKQIIRQFKNDLPRMERALEGLQNVYPDEIKHDSVVESDWNKHWRAEFHDTEVTHGDRGVYIEALSRAIHMLRERQQKK